jgi:hypothetical protein
MRLFRRGGEPSQPDHGQPEPIDHALPDTEWLAASRVVFERTVGQHYGSPESMAEPGRTHYGLQNFGVAMFFYAKAVDMLQTAYAFGQMRDRQPSLADKWIVDGYAAAVGASLAMHPQAPVGESAEYTVNMLGSIAEEVERVGMPAEIYRTAAAAYAA